MRWWAPGFEDLGRRLAEGFARATWPEPPAGWEPRGKTRMMRQVLAAPGSVASAAGLGGIVVKWSRPVTVVDRLARRLGRSKGPREGRALREAALRGLPVPRVLGYEAAPDLVATEEMAALRPLPSWHEAPRALSAAVGACLGRAYAAGLEDRDLHRDNLALSQGKVVLLDLGRARFGRPGLVATLARARHGVLGAASTSSCLRALLAFLEAAGQPHDEAALGALVVRVEHEARRLARAYRRGRDRRATRTGRHFEVFRRPDGGRGVRRREVPDAWLERLDAWAAGSLEDAERLKSSGRVLALRPDDGPGEIVLKRFGPTGIGRTPRALAAFRRAVALEHRAVDVPRPLLAYVDSWGRGVLVSERVPGADLHRFTAAGQGGELATLPPRVRRDHLQALGRTLRRMHEAEVSHRDLKAPNLLLATTPTGRPRVWIADLEGARVRRGAVAWRRRARDLARLDASLWASRTDRLRVLEGYLAVHPRPSIDRRAFVAQIAVHVRRKRGPSGTPR